MKKETAMIDWMKRLEHEAYAGKVKFSPILQGVEEGMDAAPEDAPAIVRQAYDEMMEEIGALAEMTGLGDQHPLLHELSPWTDESGGWVEMLLDLNETMDKLTPDTVADFLAGG